MCSSLNHYHLLATVYSAKQLAAFAGYFQSKIAKEVCRLHGWRDKVWARRYRHIVVLDENAQIGRLRYLLENGCKEGLVASPLDWPGAHCAGALVRGERQIAGTWVDRSRLWAASRRRGEISMRDATDSETLRLSKLPVWAGMSDDRYTEAVSDLVEEVERKTADLHRAKSTKPLGAAEIRRQDPHRQPMETKREPAPFVHATTKSARIAFRAAYNAFVAAYTMGKERLRRTGDTSGFPDGAFLPPLPVAVLEPG